MNSKNQIIGPEHHRDMIHAMIETNIEQQQNATTILDTISINGEIVSIMSFGVATGMITEEESSIYMARLDAIQDLKDNGVISQQSMDDIYMARINREVENILKETKR